MKTGMIKVTILYPNGEGKNFDMDYYCDKHLPMVARLLGDHVKGSSVERGISGGAPGSPAPYLATTSLYFDSIEDFQKSFGPNAKTIGADVPNYTNIQAEMQISEVLG